MLESIFEGISTVTQSGTNHFQNTIVVGRYAGSDSLSDHFKYNPGIEKGAKCYIKKVPSRADAIREVIGQEALRLLNPKQPKTTWILVGEDYYVVSKALPENAQQLTEVRPDTFAPGVLSGEVVGLATLTVGMQWVGENDGRKDNFFLVPSADGRTKQLVKIDGDQILAFLDQVQRKYGDIGKSFFDLNEYSFSMLPHHGSYRPYNWFDLITDYKKGNARLLSLLSCSAINENPQFIAEKQEAMQKVSTIDPAAIQQLCAAVAGSAEEGAQYSNELIARQRQISAITQALFPSAPLSVPSVVDDALGLPAASGLMPPPEQPLHAVLEELARCSTEALEQEMVRDYYEKGLVTFETKKLTYGDETPIYVDNRLLLSHQRLWLVVMELMRRQVQDLQYDRVCGVPLGGLIEAIPLTLMLNKPGILLRDHQKEHGMSKVIEGVYKVRDKVLVVEDFAETGGSMLRVVEKLRAQGVVVTDVITIFEGKTGARELLARNDCSLHCVVEFPAFLQQLQNTVKLKPEESAAIEARLARGIGKSLADAIDVPFPESAPAPVAAPAPVVVRLETPVQTLRLLPEAGARGFPPADSPVRFLSQTKSHTRLPASPERSRSDSTSHLTETISVLATKVTPEKPAVPKAGDSSSDSGTAGHGPLTQ